MIMITIMIIHDETRSNLSAEIFNLVLLEFLAPKRSIRRANVVSLFVSQSALCSSLVELVLMILGFEVPV